MQITLDNNIFTLVHRTNKKIKRISLAIENKDEIIIKTPLKFKSHMIKEIAFEYKEWILKTIHKVPSKNSFDLISIGFGVRNFQNLEKGISESFRVLRNGGTLIILETSVPQNRFIKFFYLLFSRTFIPLVGSVFSKDKKAYKYLQKSAEEFPSGKKFGQILKSCGFNSVEILPLMLGASSIYIAKKN